MKSQNVQGNGVLWQSAEEYVAYLNQYEIGTMASRKTKRDSLLGFNYGLNIINLFEHLGVKDPKIDFTETVMRSANGTLDQKILNVSVRTRVKRDTRAWMRWMIDSKYLAINPLLLKILRQKQAKPEKIEIPSKNQIEILEAMTLGKNRLQHLMNYIMFIILCLINAVRPGREVTLINEEDIDLQNAKIRIHRKGGIMQWIRIQKRHVPLLREYLNLLREYKKAHNCDDSALFIKLSPKMGRHSHNPSWRLSPSGFWQHFRTLQVKFPQLQGLKPYYLRHFACSIMAFNTVEHNGNVAETAQRNSHSVKTMMTYYYAYAGYRDEILTRRPEENVVYFKEMACRSIGKLMAAPNEIEHLFAGIEWARKIGVTQSAIDIITCDTVADDMSTIQNGLETLRNNPTLSQELRAAIPGLLALVQTWSPPKPSWPVLRFLGDPNPLTSPDQASEQGDSHADR